jgi:uncharacterized protein (TIGR02246 family)
MGDGTGELIVDRTPLQNQKVAMTMNLDLFDLAGFTGVLLIVIAYLLLQLGKLPSSSLSFSLLNAAGSLLIIASLVFKFNMSAFLIEVFWFLISLIGLSRWARASKGSTMLADKPEVWPQVFEQHFNTGDLDAVMALYEPDASFVMRSGEALVGRTAIRKVLGGMIDAKTQMHSRVVKAVTVGDIAQLYTDFEGTTVDGSGKTIAIHHKAIEVLRRQPGGDWKLVMGDPNGRQ